MRRLLLIAFALFGGCAHEKAAAPPATAAQPAASEPKALPAPPFRLPNTVKPTGYEIELTVDPAAPRFSGQERIDVVISGSPEVIWLHSQDQEVTRASLTRAGKTAALIVRRASPDVIALTTEGAFADGEASLTLEWSAPYNDRSAQGVFRHVDGDDHYAMTQFEATDARRAFPSFDEPGFKIPFGLTLIVPEKLQAFANTPERARGPAKTPGFVRVEFEKTQPLPTYLVAFAVGPYEVVEGRKAGRNGTPIRVIVTRGQSARAAFAVQEIPLLLEALEVYFGMPYPYAKLDTIEIPITGAFFGAMENVGLVTFASSLLLGDPGNDSVQRQRRFSDVAAHEYAHQWFGNLVTPRWWDDIWLNESFASWMSIKAVDKVHPDWRFDFERVRVLGSAIGSDSLRTSPQIRKPVNDEGGIATAFSGITYAKGASVLAMFEHEMGEDRFREGVRQYLTAHAHGNATAEDFLSSLSRAAGDEQVSAAFSTFIDQSGVPEVSFDVLCEKGQVPQLKLTQRRYLPLGDEATNAQQWRLPVCVRLPSGRQCASLRSAEQVVPLTKERQCPKWIVPNDGAYGYYVSRLSKPLLDGLGGVLSRSTTDAEKLRILADGYALVRSDGMSAADALALTAKVAPAGNRHLVELAAGALTGIHKELAEGALEVPFARWVDATFSQRARAAGIEPKKGEGDEDRLLRPTLVYLSGELGENAQVRAAVLKKVRAWLEGKGDIDPELFGAYLGVVAKGGDASLHRSLRQKLSSLESRRDRGDVIEALGNAVDPAVLRENLDFALGGKELNPNEGIAILFGRSRPPQARDVVWAWMTENYDALTARLSEQTMVVMPYLAAGFCDAEQAKAARAFFTPERLAKVPGADHALAQALEIVDQCSRVRAAQRASLETFLRSQR